MTKKIVWRLKEQPTSEMLRELVSSGILTKEEAREILFSLEEIVERDNDSLKAEIKFLRELVQRLSESRSQIITTIKEIEIPVYKKYPWYGPYVTWTYSSGNDITLGSGNFIDITTF